MKRKFTFFIFLLTITLVYSCTQVVDTGTTSNNSNPTSDPSKPSYTPPDSITAAIGNSGTTTNPDSLVISYVSLKPCAVSNELISFTITGKNIPSNAVYEWYFGDGNQTTSGPATITNTYAQPGTYTVLAKVDSGGKSLASTWIKITLTGAAGEPTDTFTTALLNASTLSNDYAFNSVSSVSTGTIKSYSWDFGDASVDNSNHTYVTHVYNQLSVAENYTVTLTITSSGGCSSSKSKIVSVPAGSPATTVITGGFTDTSTNPCSSSGEQFTFTGTTTNVPAGAVYTWNFGDASTGNGNPVSKTYSTGNTYQVTMTIGTYSGSVFTPLYSYQGNVTAYGQNVTPNASMSVTPVGTVGNEFIFQSTSTVTNGTIATNYWNFGDGSTTTLPSVNKTYSQSSVAKPYSVELVSTSNAGCSATTFKTVTIPAQ